MNKNQTSDEDVEREAIFKARMKIQNYAINFGLLGLKDVQKLLEEAAQKINDYERKGL